MFSALAHPIRLQIVEGLLTGDCFVNNMVDCLNLPQPQISRHLAVLRDAGVVTAEREGRKRRYRVSHPVVAAMLQCLDRTSSERGEATARMEEAS